MYGELVPIGGGDSIPLLKPQLLIGRRESCDIVLRFANVSAHHCQLLIENGYLYVRDMHSSNGIKINDLRLEKGQQRRLSPGDVLSVAKHRYRVDYDPAELGAVGPPPAEDVSEEIMSESLLTRAGLDHRAIGRESGQKRYDVTSNKAGQIKLPHQSL
ncbi:MAG TPA: FHA domain-containing protein [Lacipirellulaceae bacterium]|jgi:adenylate cyclase